MRRIKDGDMMPVVLAADTAHQVGLLVGDRVVVTAVAGKTGDEVECHTFGVFNGDCAGAIDQGKNLKFDNATKLWAVAGEGDPVHGYAHRPAAGNKVDVKLA